MKLSGILTVGLLFVSTTLAMHASQSLAIEDEEKIVTLELHKAYKLFNIIDTYTITGSHQIPKKYLILSSVIKDMLKETVNKDKVILEISVKLFKLIAPYFDLAYDVAVAPATDSEALNALRYWLGNHSDKELALILNEFNRLNIPVIQNEVSAILAKRFIQPNSISECLKKSSYVSMDGDMARKVAQEMLKELPDLKNYYLLRGWLKNPKKLTGHTKVVESVCFSPDGTLFASGSADGTVRLWDPSTGDQIGRPLIGDNCWVNSICFNSKGTIIASASHYVIRLWDLAKGIQIGNPLAGHTDIVNSVCFNHDGTLLASASSDNKIRLWDPKTGTQVGNPLTGHTNSVNSVRFNHDGTLLVSGSNDETVLLWDLHTGTHKEVLDSQSPHKGAVRAVCFNKDSTLVASGSQDKIVRLWDAQTLNLIRVLDAQWDVNDVCFSHEGSLLTSVSRFIKFWDAQRGTLLISYERPEIAEKSHFLSLIGDPERANYANPKKLIKSVCYSADDRFCAFGFVNGMIQLHCVADAELQKWFAHDIKPEQIALLKHIQTIDSLKSWCDESKIELPKALQAQIPTSLLKRIKRSLNDLGPEIGHRIMVITASTLIDGICYIYCIAAVTFGAVIFIAGIYLQIKDILNNPSAYRSRHHF